LLTICQGETIQITAPIYFITAAKARPFERGIFLVGF